MIGERIEYKNAKKAELQIGVVKDKITFIERRDENMNPISVDGYLVEEETTKTLRIVKPSRVIRII